jgi:hypothetical protein
MLSLKQAVSLSDIESGYSSLGHIESDVLRIPSSLKYGGGFGVTAALIQFFAYWSRVQKSPTLRLYSSGGSETALETLAQEPHGMAALYFAPFVEDGATPGVPTKVGLAHAVRRILAMQSGRYLDTMHGRGVFLACFAGAKNEYLLPFYAKGKSESLRGREDFAKLTAQLIDACAPSANRTLAPRRLKAIANLVYELFRNTDEHAQTDEYGDGYHRNIRGVMVKFIAYSGASVSSESSSQDVPQNLFMLRTLANQRLHVDEKGRQRAATEASFLEMTVFDTGPGLVRRWLGKNAPGMSIDEIGISEEVNYIQQCFEQHATTKDGEISGHGLTLVLDALNDLNAFLRLRTGRVCLVQDFSALKVAKFSPRHWLKDRHQLPLVAGAAYSIIIPLSRGAK